MPSLALLSKCQGLQHVADKVAPGHRSCDGTRLLSGSPLSRLC